MKFNKSDIQIYLMSHEISMHACQIIISVIMYIFTSAFSSTKAHKKVFDNDQNSHETLLFCIFLGQFHSKNETHNTHTIDLFFSCIIAALVVLGASSDFLLVFQ